MALLKMTSCVNTQIGFFFECCFFLNDLFDSLMGLHAYNEGLCSFLYFPFCAFLLSFLWVFVFVLLAFCFLLGREGWGSLLMSVVIWGVQSHQQCVAPSRAEMTHLTHRLIDQ